MEPVRHSRLRYVDAGDIEDSRVDFDGLDVYNPSGSKLGDVDGFIIDTDSNRPYFVVVDSGGWFSSQRYLVPIGHTRLDTDNDRLRIDIEREAIKRFPPFDPDRFGDMSEKEATRYNEQLLMACCPEELKGRYVEGRWDYDAWSHYRVPDWWQSRPVGSTTASAGTAEHIASSPSASAYSVPPPPGVVETHEPIRTPREEIVARRADTDRDSRDEDDTVQPTRRPQPGDVLGIAHGGETTTLGDTRRDEAKRLKDAERDAREEAEREAREDRER